MIVESRELRDKTRVYGGRRSGGRALAALIREAGIKADVILAIPAGGAPVAAEVASALAIPAKAVVVRKVLYPWTTEAGFGAVSWLGDVHVDWRLAELAALTPRQVEECIQRALASVEERSKLYRRLLPEAIRGRAIVVDDGMATGYTMLVAVKAARKLGASWVAAAAPTASARAAALLAQQADAVVAPNLRTHPIYAVADAYRKWRDLSDVEALRALEELGETS
ncbi:MAG: phosphoribosyltransferase [Thermoproteota archaeon]|nr:MAG: phosphoribosyltransferase [Candidatus Korarchaeota archaeon]